MVWRTPLPSAPELYNLAADPSEKENLAAKYALKVADLQKRINELAATMAKPLFLQTEFDAIRQRLHAPPAFPNEEFQFSTEP